MLMEFGDIIQDIMNDTNLDIDFSYEDGLRLSELMGRAQDLQFRIDNYQMFTWGDHGVFILIGALISLAVMLLVIYWASETPYLASSASIWPLQFASSAFHFMTVCGWNMSPPTIASIAVPTMHSASMPPTKQRAYV